MGGSLALFRILDMRKRVWFTEFVIEFVNVFVIEFVISSQIQMALFRILEYAEKGVV